MQKNHEAKCSNPAHDPQPCPCNGKLSECPTCRGSAFYFRGQCFTCALKDRPTLDPTKPIVIHPSHGRSVIWQDTVATLTRENFLLRKEITRINMLLRVEIKRLKQRQA